MTEERAAGEPAARLFAHVIQETADLDMHRRQLADGNSELDEFLRDIEVAAVEQMRGTAQDWLTTCNESAEPVAPSIRDRVRHGMGQLGIRTRRGRRKPKAPRQRIVQGSVVEESAGDEAGMAPSDTVAGHESP